MVLRPGKKRSEAAGVRERRSAAARTARAAETDDAGRNLVHAADHNLRITLEAIRRSGPLSRADLSAVTGLSGAGIGNILRQLAAAGLVEAVERTRGRSSGFRLAQDAVFGLGVDVPEDGDASAVLVDLCGRRALPVRRVDPADARAIDALVDDVAALCGGRDFRQLAGCGIALASPADRGRRLAGLERAFGAVPITVASDAAAASLGELHFGMPDEKSFVHVLIGRRVRAGLMIRGRLFEGVHGRAGGIGRMRLGAEGGSLDDLAGAETLPDLGSVGEAEPGAGFAAWLDRTAPPLLDAVVAMAGFLAPGAVVVGGRLPAACLGAIARRLSRDAAERMRHPLQPNWLPPIVPATLAEDGAAMGAAALPFFNRLLPDPRR